MKTQNRFIGGFPFLPLLAALLVLLLCSGATAEAGTVFPWRAYVLDVTLASSDPALVAMEDAPTDGLLVIVELTTLTQGMALDDIQTYYTEFALRDANSDEYAPYMWRLRDVTVDADGKLSATPQDTMELIYYLKDKDASALENAQLMIDTERPGERIVVSLAKAPSTREMPADASADVGDHAEPLTTEPTPQTLQPELAPTHTASPEPTATITPTTKDWVREMLHAALVQRGEAASKKPWVKAVYEAGFQNLSVEGDNVSFQLRSFDPKPKSLEEGETDALQQLMKNASAFDLDITLVLEEQAFTAKSLKAMDTVVTKAAAAAQKAFGDKRVKAALKDWLLPSPIEKVKQSEDLLVTTDAFSHWIEQSDALFSGCTPQVWAPLFYGQTKQTLSAKNGPYSLTFTCVSIHPEDLLKNASKQALSTVAKQPASMRASGDALDGVFINALASNAFTMRKKANEKFTLTLSVDDIAQGKRGDAYEAYVARYNCVEVLRDFKAQVEDLPEAAALDYPMSGRLRGSTSGTKIIIKAPKDGQGRYIQLRSYDSDAFAVSGFIQPGKSCTVRVPQGDYYLLIAVGVTWYGEEIIFGEQSVFSRTGLFEVASRRYYHTVTLEPKSGGNLPLYGVSGDEFAQ